MYDIIKNVIESGIYELTDMLNKINAMWVQSNIDETQKNELIELAQLNADPSQSNKPLQEQLNKAFEEITTLKEVVQTQTSEIKAIKDKLAEGGTVVPEPEPQPSEEYPEWEPYNGIPPVKYQNGSKCSHNGKKWLSMVDDNIWEPGALGVGEEIWKLVE